MSRTLFFAGASAVVAALCIAALLVMTGRWDSVRGTPLTAQVLLNDVAVPSNYAIDPVVITDELLRRMQDRAGRDLALSIMMGDQGLALMREQALPRLLNAGVVRRMLEDMDGLGQVIAYSDYRSFAQVQIVNRSGAPLEDVALTLPGAVLAERDGAALPIRAHDNGLMSVSFATLDANETAALNVWFALEPGAVASRSEDIRLGADHGVRGTVQMFRAAPDWNGAELQDRSWARWLVSGTLLAVVVAALAALALLLVVALRRTRLSRA
ncbi:MAG: hypothetical protein VX874_23835 [Pseudomonadota bacterium]|nr:hypothetical protein [Pseudomonadota bacterium]